MNRWTPQITLHGENKIYKSELWTLQMNINYWLNKSQFLRSFSVKQRARISYFSTTWLFKYNFSRSTIFLRGYWVQISEIEQSWSNRSSTQLNCEGKLANYKINSRGNQQWNWWLQFSLFIQQFFYIRSVVYFWFMILVDKEGDWINHRKLPDKVFVLLC